MILIENVNICGWEPAIRGMRNPMNSWNRSDSLFIEDGEFHCLNGDSGPYYGPDIPECNFQVGEADRELMLKLAKAGAVHGKYRRMIAVYLDITAPLYWWKEFDTYRTGITPNPMDIEMNSCSTMHKIHAKEFTLEDFSHEQLITEDVVFEDERCCPIQVLEQTVDALNMFRHIYLKTNDKKYWWQMIQLLGSSYNQRRTVKLNYEVLANIYQNRRNHKLDEWLRLCEWIESLPCSEIITLKEDNDGL